MFLNESVIIARITDCRITDYIGFNVVGKRRITECGVVAVAVVSIGSSIGGSSGGSADYGLWDNGFVGITDWVRISRGYGLQDHGLS